MIDKLIEQGKLTYEQRGQLVGFLNERRTGDQRYVLNNDRPASFEEFASVGGVDLRELGRFVESFQYPDRDTTLVRLIKEAMTDSERESFFVLRKSIPPRREAGGMFCDEVGGIVPLADPFADCVAAIVAIRLDKEETTL